MRLTGPSLGRLRIMSGVAMPDPTPDDQSRRPEPPATELCPDCWGESDPIDDAFRCGTCQGRGWVEDLPDEDEE